MRYEILISAPTTAADNMARDSALLESLTLNPRCVLHFYEWEQPSATYGYFIDPDQFFKCKQGLQLARRPTGGGIIFHTCDFAFSLLLPATHPRYSLNPLESYAWINHAVLNSIQKPNLDILPCEPKRKGAITDSFCMAKSTCYDLLLEGKKVGGAAQRRVKQGLLHQGSIALGVPDRALLCEWLYEGEQIVEEMERNSYALLGSHTTFHQVEEVRRELRFALFKSLQKELVSGPRIGESIIKMGKHMFFSNFIDDSSLF